jgi:hypothetical protein
MLFLVEKQYLRARGCKPEQPLRLFGCWRVHLGDDYESIVPQRRAVEMRKSGDAEYHLLADRGTWAPRSKLHLSAVARCSIKFLRRYLALASSAATCGILLGNYARDLVFLTYVTVAVILLVWHRVALKQAVLDDAEDALRLNTKALAARADHTHDIPR